MCDSQTLTWATPLRWVSDGDRVVLVDEYQRASHILRGPEAAVWGWLMQAYSYPQVVKLLAALGDEADALAEQRLRHYLAAWQQAGWLS